MKKTVQFVGRITPQQSFKSSSCGTLFLGIFTFLIIFSSCSKNDDQPEKSDSSCKDRPGQIAYGKTTFDFVDNAQGNPVKLTTTKTISVKQPAGVITTVYAIEYDAQARVSKVSRLTDSKPDGYCVPEYNANGQMVKLGEYDVPGRNNVHATATYDNGGRLVKISALVDGDTNAQTCNYTYDGANLIKKSITHFFDPVSNQFIDADFTYDYHADKENKTKPFFTGLLGLRIMADFAGSKSIFYIANAERGQLLFAQEGTLSKNVLKHLKGIAQRYNKSDDTDINYTYEYDGDGFVKYQKAESHNVITKTELSPFGVPVVVTIPTDFTSAFSIEYLCP